jgi:ketosteroid isomerase-like protein
MSQANIETVRRAIDSFNRVDIRSAMQEADDDFEMDWSNSIAPQSGVYRGQDQVIRLFESFVDAWDEVHWEPQELIDLDAERVLVVNRVRMRGRASGAEVQAVGAQVWTVRNGRLASVKLFQSKADALEAVSLSDQDVDRSTGKPA